MTRELNWLFFALASAMALGLLLGERAMILDKLDEFHGDDFGTFYRAARTGRPYGPDPEAPFAQGVSYPNLNPPHLLLLVKPLTSLDLWTARRIWLLISFTVFAAAAWHLAVPRTWWLIPLLLGWEPTLALIQTGQVTSAIAVPLWLAWWADRNGDGVKAGAWMGPVVVTKPFFGIVLVWWLIEKEWRRLGTAAATGAVTIAVGASVYGVESYRIWLETMAAVRWPWVVLNASFWGPWARACGPAGTFTSFERCPSGAYVVFVAALAVIFCVTLWRAVMIRNRDAAWALLLMTMLLVSPLGWVYYTWWVLAPLSRLRLPRWSAIAGALCLIPPDWVIWMASSWSPWAGVTIGSAYAWGLTCWWAGLMTTVAESPDRLHTSEG